MSGQSVILEFVDQCQAEILNHENEPLFLLHRLQASTYGLSRAVHSLSVTDRVLAGVAVERLLIAVAVHQGLSSDSQLAWLMTAILSARSNIDCEALFSRWHLLLHANPSPTSSDPRVRRALKFIRRGYRSRLLSRERTAQVIRVSPWYLDRLLHRETNLTFTELKRLARMDAACHLLRSTQLLEKEIAPLVGYADERGLRRDFNRKLGVSPTVYRKTQTGRR